MLYRGILLFICFVCSSLYQLISKYSLSLPYYFPFLKYKSIFIFIFHHIVLIFTVLFVKLIFKVIFAKSFNVESREFSGGFSWNI